MVASGTLEAGRRSSHVMQAAQMYQIENVGDVFKYFQVDVCLLVIRHDVI
jgi:hypothetical protein